MTTMKEQDISIERIYILLISILFSLINVIQPISIINIIIGCVFTSFMSYKISKWHYKENIEISIYCCLLVFIPLMILTDILIDYTQSKIVLNILLISIPCINLQSMIFNNDEINVKNFFYIPYNLLINRLKNYINNSNEAYNIKKNTNVNIKEQNTNIITDNNKEKLNNTFSNEKKSGGYKLNDLYALNNPKRIIISILIVIVLSIGSIKLIKLYNSGFFIHTPEITVKKQVTTTTIYTNTTVFITPKENITITDITVNNNSSVNVQFPKTILAFNTYKFIVPDSSDVNRVLIELDTGRIVSYTFD